MSESAEALAVQLQACADDLGLAIEARKVELQRQIDRLPYAEPGLTVWHMLDSNGNPVLGPLLAARVQALAALADLEKR